MVHKYIIDKADIHDLLTGKEIPLPQGNKARAFCVEIAGGMTNGEVIQALFPNLDNANDSAYFSKVRNMEGHFIKTDKEFWNTSYEKEVSE